MKRWLGHPGLRRLSELADGVCDPERADALREHLSDCGRCQRELAFILELRAASRELPTPRPPAGLKEEILARWEAGERRILPLHDPPSAPSRPRFAGLIGLGAALLLAVAVAVFLRVGEAAAGASQLRLSPEAPVAGEPLEVDYRTPSDLAGEETLRLRARYRQASDLPSGDRLGRALDAPLERAGAGRFRGRLRLPDAAVYAAFSVEDLEGTRVDANGGRLWEVLARDEAGRPTFEALLQRMRALEGARWAAALETARRITELYPERILGWSYLLLYEGFLLEGARRDSLVGDHRQRLSAFERSVTARVEPDLEDVAALVGYARTLGDEEATARWIARLSEVSPRHRLVVQHRVVEAGARYRDRPDRLLDALEEEWDRSGPADPSLLNAGFRAALLHGRPGPILEWGDRIDRYAPHWSSWVATQVAALPELREEGIARLRRELARLDVMGPDVRPLDRSVREHRAANRRLSARLLTGLGRAHAARGERAAAREVLRRAAASTWAPDLFRELAELHLELDDTAAAVRLLARAAADPLAPPLDPRSPVSSLASRVDGSEWERLLAEARAELRRHLLERAERRRIAEDVRVMDPAGRELSLPELLDAGPDAGSDAAPGAGPTLVVFWSRHSWPAVRALPRLREASPLLEAAGVRMAVVVEGEPSPEAAEALRRAGVRAPVLFDARAEFARALELWQTPLYVVAGRDGRVRARERELEEGLRLALVLAREGWSAD